MHYAWIHSAYRDVAHGFRVLRRHPAVFSCAVLVLGLTLGFTIALVLLTDFLLLRPVSIGRSDRLVQIVRPAAPGGFAQDSFPSGLIEQLRERVNSFGTLLTVGYPGDGYVSFSPSGFHPESGRTQSVDVAAFATLGTLPTAGRLFVAGDAQVSAEPVAILSHNYWQKRFAKAPNVIGKSIRRRDKSFRIVVVLQDGFTELDAGS